LKFLANTVLALALIATLLSGLCFGCVQAGAEHKCCRPKTQAPSCHEPQPEPDEKCACPDSSHLNALAPDAKATVKLVKFEQVAIVVPEAPAPVQPAGLVPVHGRWTFDIPPPDVLALNAVLRI
jgi:hypothetical protein